MQDYIPPPPPPATMDVDNTPPIPKVTTVKESVATPTNLKKKKVTTKKKKKTNLQPLISTRVQPYSMVEDIKNQQARITFGQLLEISPRCRADLVRGIRKPTTRNVNFSENEEESATALYCDAQVKGIEIPLIIDSGAAGSIVSCRLLDELKIHIDRPSTTMMINVNGERKRPLGEIVDFPITVKNVTIPINVVVTEAETYSAIVGNDWLSKVKANIDYETSTMTLQWKGSTAEIPVEYRLMPIEKRRLQEISGLNQEEGKEEDEDEEEESEEEEEYEEDEPDERPYFTMLVERNPTIRPIPAKSISLNCSLDKAITNTVYTSKDYVLTNEGVYIDRGYYTWDHIRALDRMFKRRPPRMSRWVFDWKGPRAHCWCDESLHSPEDSCGKCQYDLVKYLTVRRISPTIIQEISQGYEDCDPPTDERRNYILESQPYHQLLLQKVVDENNRQLCQYCGRKSHLEYERLIKEVEYHHADLQDVPEGSHITELSIGELSQDHELAILRFLVRHHDHFAWEPSQLGRTNIIKHTIVTEGNKPIRKHWYRTSKSERDFIEKELVRLLEEGLIEKATGPWAAPVVLVRKKNGKIRLCVDYRDLNSITIKDAYPLPRIDDMLDSFGKAKWFTSLDLASGYWQVEMDEKDRPKTAFITQFGTYQFKVMPFGLCNALATFQRLMDEVFRGLLWKFVMVYLDDVIIYSETFEQHLEHLQIVFNRLKKAGLKLNPDKCDFVKSELEFLGHVVSDKGIRTDPAKIEKVKNFPIPTNITQLRGFLGLALYYRRFVPDFSTIAVPLNKLLKKGVTYSWTDQQQKAFDALKSCLISSPVLTFPDFKKTFVLLTDASTFGLGAILSQTNEEGHEQVIAYASRSLNKAERNYSATELECLAVVWAIKHFHPYVYGQRFQLITDHSALCHLFNTATPSGRLARWVMKLQMYDFQTIHRAGKKHLNVDSLSRIH